MTWPKFRGDHIVQVENLIRELGSKLTKNNEKVCFLLLTMPDKYETVITALF